MGSFHPLLPPPPPPPLSVLDLGQIGMNGQEPDVLLKMRQSVVDNPLISRFLQEDELNIIKDPLAPLKKVMNVGPDGMLSPDNVPGLNATNSNALTAPDDTLSGVSASKTTEATSP